MEPETIDYPRGLTFEQVWASIQELAKADDRRSREMKEMHAETERMHVETERMFRETDRKIDRMAKNLGGLNRKFGKLAEHLVAPGIMKRFNELGFHFSSMAPGGQRILDGQGNTRAEIDLLLENGETIIAVEVKSQPAEKDIPHHIRRLEILRDHRDQGHDRRKILGGIAGAIFPPAVKELVLEAGMYVIEQSGDTMKIAVPEGFVPREW